MDRDRWCHLLFGFAGGVGVTILYSFQRDSFASTTPEIVYYLNIICSILLICSGIYGEYLMGDSRKASE